MASKDRSGHNIRFRDILRSLKLSDVFLFAYLATQIVQWTGTQLDVWACRVFFVMYVSCAFLFEYLPEQRSGRRKFFTKISVWAWVFYCFAVVSSFWSIDISYSLDATYINNILHIVVLVTFISYSARTRKDLNKYLAIFLLATVYLAIALLVLTPSSSWGTERIGREIGMNANSIGLMMSTGCLLCLYFVSGRRNKWILLLMPLFIWIALYSGSRKAFFVLLLFVAGFLIFRARGFKAFLVLLFLVVPLLAFWKLVMTNNELYAVIGVRIEQLVYSITGSNSITDFSLIERANYRRWAMELFFGHPVVGIGMNGFMGYMAAVGYGHVAYSHCNYTELLCNFGLIGFLLYYGLFAQMVWDGFSLIAKRDSNVVFALILLLGILIADYGMVSYIDITTIMCITFSWCALNVSKRESYAYRSSNERISVQR